ncbi:MAG: ABC transporter ATP-binding protein [Gammaproteobacteria bacterium]|nr:ABC transporter ATP-binding protein [Gammaproteobacteria bacterium]
MLSKEHIIDVQNLTTRLGEHTIHEHLNLTVQRGEILGIVGGSGTGKSVLMKTIIGLIKPSSGHIRVFGQDISALSESKRQAIGKRWGVLFQDGALFSSLTVAQNVEAVLREAYALPRDLVSELASLKIKMVGLPTEAGDKFPSELSGGMRKRAGLARALVLDPEIVFLDEPTAGLDPIAAAALDELIQYLQKTLGLTVLIVTHDLDSLYAICDRIAVLAEKQVLVTAPLDELVKHPHPWIQAYFHGVRTREQEPLSMDIN